LYISLLETSEEKASLRAREFSVFLNTFFIYEMLALFCSFGSILYFFIIFLYSIFIYYLFYIVLFCSIFSIFPILVCIRRGVLDIYFKSHRKDTMDYKWKFNYFHQITVVIKYLNNTRNIITINNNLTCYNTYQLITDECNGFFLCSIDIILKTKLSWKFIVRLIQYNVLTTNYFSQISLFLKNIFLKKNCPQII